MTSVAQERAKLAAAGMVLRRRNEWGSRFDYSSVRPVTEPAVKVFVHISVTNPSAFRSNDAHARAIEQIGISRFPATGISYNRGIMPDGSAYEFQPIGRRGAHTGAFTGNCSSPGCPFRGGTLTSKNWNIAGRGYVICQNVDDPVSSTQLDSLARVIAADQLAGFVNKGVPIHGHRCVSDKDCPGGTMWKLMERLATLVETYVTHGLPGTVPTPEPQPLTGAPEMILVRQDMGTQADRIWLLSADAKRHVQSVTAFNTLKAHLPFKSDPPIGTNLLQSFTSGAPVTDIIEDEPAPPQEPLPVPPAE